MDPNAKSSSVNLLFGAGVLFAREDSPNSSAGPKRGVLGVHRPGRRVESAGGHPTRATSLDLTGRETNDPRGFVSIHVHRGEPTMKRDLWTGCRLARGRSRTRMDEGRRDPHVPTRRHRGACGC